MANPEHLAKLKEGVEAWNAWREENPDIRPNLFEADLCGADLKEANLNEVNLNGANLYGVTLRRADFIGASLCEADLLATSLRWGNLNGANLTGANLTSSDLTGARLSGVDLSNALLYETVFADLDLSCANGLDTCRHNGPSIIDHRTLTKSSPLPLEFLRGCGLSDWEIEATKLHNPDLTPNQISEIQYRVFELRSARPIQTRPLFISYSHANSEFVDKLEPLLHDAGILFWRDTHDMLSGRMDRQIERAIDENRTLLIVLSESSVESDWIEYEIDRGTKLSKKVGRDTLCPIALDDAWKDCDWPGPLRKQIQNFNILDFSEWRDPEKLDQMFRRLIRGLELFYKPKEK